MGEHVAVVADKEGVRHVGQFLRVLLGEVDGGGHLVRDDVIHVIGTAGARVTQPHNLEGHGQKGAVL